MAVAKKDQKTYRIEDPDTNLCNYSHLIFNKGGQNINWRKGSIFNKWSRENRISTCRILKLGHDHLVLASIQNGLKILM
jgi:hypothetical protein